jgi:DNA-binding transcriptional ArsR family regulator
MKKFQNRDEIPLDRADIDALSSEVRVALLKAIDNHPGTISEFAEKLGLAKSTVHQHMCILAENGFVVADPQRKWRCYTLTQKASRILHPERGYRIVFVFGISFFTFIFGVYLVVAYINGYIVQGTSIVYDPVVLISGELLLALSLIIWILMFWWYKREALYSETVWHHAA